jgi:hypothetical protein
MVEPLLGGIVLGLVVATILGLLADAYWQYRRTNLRSQQFTSSSVPSPNQTEKLFRL